jgi:hypothetical protein
MRWVRWGLAVAGLAVGVGGAAQAKVPVTVEVKDPSGAAVLKAEVQFLPKDADEASMSTTDTQGGATVALAPGDYRLRVAAPGFVAMKESVGISGAATIPVMLGVASGCPPCTVIVQPSDALTTEVPGPQALLQSAEVPAAGSVVKSDVLVIEAGPGERGVFTAASLGEYPQTKVTVFDHHANKNLTYAGVPLMELLAHLGVPHGKNLMGKPLQDYVVATGSDGYMTVLSLGEVDPDFHPGMVLVADEVDGMPLDAKTGPFRLVVSEDRNATRSVWKLVKIEVRKAE